MYPTCIQNLANLTSAVPEIIMIAGIEIEKRSVVKIKKSPYLSRNGSSYQNQIYTLFIILA